MAYKSKPVSDVKAEAIEVEKVRELKPYKYPRRLNIKDATTGA